MTRLNAEERRVEKLRIADIRYNPQRVGFEALVTVHEGGQTFRYPAFLPAPLHAEFRLVARGLTEKALLAHKAERPGLRMHMRTAPVSAPLQPPLAA